MTLNIPPKVRVAIYLLTALGTPVIAYLNAREIIGTLEVTLWSAEVAIVGGMAALKTQPMKGDE